MPDAVIHASELHKSYESVEAVKGIDLEVRAGEIFAFLGPNGAGKTTTVEILEGYRTATSGTVRVLGEDPADATNAWRDRIGIVLQQGGLYDRLRVRESMEMFAGYFSRPLDVDETIALVGLADKSEERIGRLSGGQRRRVDVGLALIGDPELLFLDEPTTGFDPAARRDAWKMIAGLRDLGKTVFLTTHYMEEAQVLADRVAILVDGRIVAEGTPETLSGHLGGSEIRLRLPAGAPIGDLDHDVEMEVDDMGLATIRATDTVAALNALTTWAMAHGIDLPGLTVSPPRLEDVYLEVTTNGNTNS